IALLDGEVNAQGTISLPLRPDLLDRPRQMVDPEHGKSAETGYRVLEHRNGQTLVELTPHTGRTHQLRVHCAHQSGLACPIVGDRLYGKPAQRLCLHAAELAFMHPVTGKRLHFSSSAPF
ncbi:MAG: RluA family pseudouridine synthase, partial [Prevotella sp.]|nr:RluA family pseudouridine synthase [Prevotella sp.]